MNRAVEKREDFRLTVVAAPRESDALGCALRHAYDRETPLPQDLSLLLARLERRSLRA